MHCIDIVVFSPQVRGGLKSLRTERLQRFQERDVPVCFFLLFFLFAGRVNTTTPMEFSEQRFFQAPESSKPSKTIRQGCQYFTEEDALKNWKVSKESLMLESCASNVSGVCHFRRNVPTFFGTTIWQNTSDYVLEKALRFFNKAL